ncbi:MAG: hypothetical protein E7L30_10130 [Lactococcus lactis]|nr:hypothetical protein [Lactococcus cremoris]MDU1526789.1 hypothetical protein [Lactococcus lactis]MDU1630606.1 hypothetical protein [Lactococcus lactis]MDU2185869.1 hypothetical protein [Lactococcus lactis]MDU4036676.1 hypothetical protein [Lactococcus lactis]MDU7301233.1 hypothetical protein [Lactococcus lactis]
MFVRFHPISRVKLLFGAAFLFVVNLQQYYQKHNDML